MCVCMFLLLLVGVGGAFALFGTCGSFAFAFLLSASQSKLKLDIRRTHNDRTKWQLPRLCWQLQQQNELLQQLLLVLPGAALIVNDNAPGTWFHFRLPLYAAPHSWQLRRVVVNLKFWRLASALLRPSSTSFWSFLFFFGVALNAKETNCNCRYITSIYSCTCIWVGAFGGLGKCTFYCACVSFH